MSASRDQLLDILFHKSFMYREDPPFKLSSGGESFYYFDCKASTLDHRGVTLIGEAMMDLVAPLVAEKQVQGIGGLTLGADPIAISTAIAAGRRGQTLWPLVVRKEPKKHGTAKWIEGDLSAVKRVIALDDVITTGASTITAIERMREGGLEVVAAAVIIDRMEGGRASIEKLGVPVMALYTREDFDRKRKA